MAAGLKPNFKKDPRDKDFNPKEDIDWEGLCKPLKVKLVSYGGVHLSESSMQVPGLLGQLGLSQRHKGSHQKQTQASGPQANRKNSPDGRGEPPKPRLPLRIWARGLEDGSMIHVREDGQVWLEGPEFVNITAPEPQRFVDILSGFSLNGLTPVESQVYDEESQTFRMTSEGGGAFSGYDLLPALFEAKEKGLDLQLKDAEEQPIPWVFGSKDGGGQGGDKKGKTGKPK